MRRSGDIAANPTTPTRDRVRRPILPTARRAVTLGLTLLVFIVSLLLNLNELPASRFHPDESRWINRAHYLRDLRDPIGEAWEDRYLIRGQPPMGSYVIGLGLLLQGRDLTTNGPWDFHRGEEFNISWNVIYGLMPSQADLEASRRTNAVIGALTVAAVFLIVTRLTNRAGGLIGALFLAINPLHIYLSSMALSDALLTLIIALATLAIMWLADRPSWPRAALLGMLLGFGASAKLTPLFLSFGLAAVGIVILLGPHLRRFHRSRRVRDASAHAGVPGGRNVGWFLLALPAITCAAFVLSYPYLWSDPIDRTMNLIDFRQREMASQARIWSDRAVDTRIESLDLIWTSFRDKYSSSGRLLEMLGNLLGRSWGPTGFDPPFELAGIVLFTAVALRRGLRSRHFLALALLGGQAIGIWLGMRVDFNRYFLPLLLFFAVCIGVLAGLARAWLPQLFFAVVRRRREAPAARQTSPIAAD